MKKLYIFFFIISMIILLIITCTNPSAEQSDDGGGGSSGDSTPPDTEGPVVQIVNPVNAQFVSGEILIVGVATDSSEIKSVEIKIDSAAFQEVSSPGSFWSYDLETTSLSEGGHSITVRATDINDNLGEEAAVNFTVDQTVPSITITSPLHGDIVKGNYIIQGDADDDNGIKAVYVNPNGGTQYYEATGTTSWNYSYDSTQIADGDVIISAMAYDNADLPGVMNISIIVDNTPPSLSITSHSDEDTVSGIITLEGTASDTNGINKVEVKIDSDAYDPATGTTSWSYAINTTTLTEGAHTISVIATDNAEIITQQTITLYVDQDPPSITITGPANESYIKGDGNLIYGTVSNLDQTNDIIQIKYNSGSFTNVDNFDPLGGTNWDHTIDTITDGLSDGQLNIYIKALDYITNAFDIETVTYYVDNTAPSGTIESPQALSIVAGTVLVTGTASDNLGIALTDGIIIEINDGTTDLTSDITSSLSNNQWYYSWDTTTFNGDCTIDITIKDKAGNTYSPSPIVVTKDDSAPSITISDPANGDFKIVKSGVTFIVTGTATDTSGDTPGINKVEVQIDSLGWNDANFTDPTWDYTTSTLTLSDGNHDIYARVTDLDANASTLKISIVVDNTPPTVSITYPTSDNTGDTNYLYSTVNAEGSASDTYLNKVQVKIDIEATTDATGTTSWSYNWDTVAYPMAKNGTVFKAIASDMAGNTTETFVTVDVRPKIESLSVDSEFSGTQITVNGYNFDTSGIIVKFDNTDDTNVTPGLSTSFDVTIPGSATSGNVTVVENGLTSNGVYLDVWEKIDTDADGASENALAISGTDTYHAIYMNKDLYFSKNSAVASEIEGNTAPNEQVGHHPSITICGSNVYIAYIETKNYILKFAKAANPGVGGDFTKSNIVGSNIADAMTSIDSFFDGSNDTIGITYQDISPGNLKYIKSTDNGATWGTPETIDSSGITGEYSSMAYDSDGIPYIVYYDTTTTKIKFAYYTGVVWVTKFIESSTFVGEHPSIAIDASNGIYISCYDGFSGDLKYAYASSKTSDFAVTTIDYAGITGKFTDIALDSDENPHIAFINDNYSTIKYAYKTGSVWNTIDTPNSLGTVNLAKLSIVYDSNGYMHIGYTKDEGNDDAHQIIYRP